MRAKALAIGTIIIAIAGIGLAMLFWPQPPSPELQLTALPSEGLHIGSRVAFQSDMPITELRFSSDGTYGIAVGQGEDYVTTVYVWEIAKNTLLYTLTYNGAIYIWSIAP